MSCEYQTVNYVTILSRSQITKAIYILKYRDLADPKNHIEICDIANDWVKSGDLSQNRFLENYGNLSEASLSF